jgi:hypothetical protein
MTGPSRVVSARAPGRRAREDGGVEGTVQQLPVGRILAVDDRGVGLRCTWHLERGFINLSLWRDDTCVETFHLAPGDAARLVSFLVTGMADAIEEPATTPVPESPPPAPSWWARLRRSLAKRLAA